MPASTFREGGRKRIEVRIFLAWDARHGHWPEGAGSRPWLGALLLAYYDPNGRLVYAGHVGTGIKQAEIERLWRRLQPLAISKMPLEVMPPRTSR